MDDYVVFTCQHGPKECAGNRIHSCSALYSEEQAKRVEIVACLMSNGPENAELVRVFYQTSEVVLNHF